MGFEFAFLKVHTTVISKSENCLCPHPSTPSIFSTYRTRTNTSRIREDQSKKLKLMMDGSWPWESFVQLSRETSSREVFLSLLSGPHRRHSTTTAMTQLLPSCIRIASTARATTSGICLTNSKISDQSSRESSELRILLPTLYKPSFFVSVDRGPIINPDGEI